jgi:transposase
VAAVEIVPRIERRRKWTVEEKAALLAEVEAEGGKVKLVARRHRISESLLYNWRSAWKMAVSMRPPQAPEFVALGVLSEAGDGMPAQAAPRPEERIGGIEITLRNGTRLRVDGLVNETALLRVLRALKEAV